MSVEGVNAVARQELKDPLGQRTSPAQPGASQKWAFPLTTCCVLCSVNLALAHIFFLQIITLFSITEMCHWLQYSWITDTKGNLSSTNRLGKQSNERNGFHYEYFLNCSPLPSVHLGIKMAKIWFSGPKTMATKFHIKLRKTEPPPPLFRKCS